MLCVCTLLKLLDPMGELTWPISFWLYCNILISSTCNHLWLDLESSFTRDFLWGNHSHNVATWTRCTICHELQEKTTGCHYYAIASNLRLHVRQWSIGTRSTQSIDLSNISIERSSHDFGTSTKFTNSTFVHCPNDSIALVLSILVACGALWDTAKLICHVSSDTCGWLYHIRAGWNITHSGITLSIDAIAATLQNVHDWFWGYRCIPSSFFGGGGGRQSSM